MSAIAPLIGSLVFLVCFYVNFRNFAEVTTWSQDAETTALMVFLGLMAMVSVMGFLYFFARFLVAAT